MRRERVRAKYRRWIIGVVVFVAGLVGFKHSAWADVDDTAQARPAQPIALVGALIRTQSDAGDFVGAVVIKDRQIAAIGPNVTPPANARVINLAGHVITPGWIDARSTLWMNPTTVRESGRDASLNIIDGIDPYADDWRDAARQGVTAVYVQPHNSGSLGGAGAVLRVGPTISTEELVVRHPAGVQAALGVPGAATAPAANPLAEVFARFGLPAPPPQPAAGPPTSNALTRHAAFESLRGQFDAAKKYGENKPAQKDAGKELLLRAMQKEMPLRLEVGHEDDVRNSMKLAELGVRLVYERLDRVAALPEELATNSHTVVIGPMVGTKKPAELRKLALDGRKFVIATFGDEPRATSWLRLHVSAAIGDGFPRDRVLRSVTRDAAELLGASDKLGSLAEGRVADLVVFSGEPTDASVPVRMTISQGMVTYENHNNPTVNDAASIMRASSKDSPKTSAGFVASHIVTFDELASDSDAAQLRGSDGLARDDKKLADFRDGGFSRVVVSPGSSNVLAGTMTVVDAMNKEPAADCGFKFVLTSAARNNERYPASLAGQVDFIRNRLNGKKSTSHLYLPAPIRAAIIAQRDERVGQVRDGKLTAYFEANTRAEIRAALELVREFKLRGVLLQPRQIEDLVDEIRAANVGVVIGPIRSTDRDRFVNGVVALANAGVPIMMGGGDASELRNSAAVLINAGLSRTLAASMLTGPKSDQFGWKPSPGNPQGSDANTRMIVWDGDPLDPGAKPVTRSGGRNHPETPIFAPAATDDANPRPSRE